MSVPVAGHLPFGSQFPWGANGLMRLPVGSSEP
jgi:hypothetical protein